MFFRFNDGMDIANSTQHKTQFRIRRYQNFKVNFPTQHVNQTAAKSDES
ncbi:MAG: hypothetical protein LBE18_10115 [Planctomycetaceae bacterium]|nr:hypothetical protein [Planctomycetaceae bacterium]